MSVLFDFIAVDNEEIVQAVGLVRPSENEQSILQSTASQIRARWHEEDNANAVNGTPGALVYYRLFTNAKSHTLRSGRIAAAESALSM
jgi:hypothetical protein